jgi:hypothetical protein
VATRRSIAELITAGFRGMCQIIALTKPYKSLQKGVSQSALAIQMLVDGYAARQLSHSPCDKKNKNED